MSQDHENGGAGAELWARARDGWREAMPRAEEPDALTLAAYLDGNLDAAGQEAVEAWMASAPEALDLVIAAREGQDESPVLVPDSLLDRAQGLVRDRRRPRQGLAAWLRDLAGFQMAAWRPVAWAGVAAVMLVVSAGSFELGRQGTLGMAETQTAAVDDLGFGLSDSADELL